MSKQLFIRACYLWAVIFLILTAWNAQLLAEQIRVLPPIHELKGISSVGLSVGGLPTPIGASKVSNESIRQLVKSILNEADLKVIDDRNIREAADLDQVETLLSAPSLVIRVNVPQHHSHYFYVISLELTEPCHNPRNPEERTYFCTTYSIYPRLGFFEPGQESKLNSAVVDAVKQFVDKWIYDQDDPTSN